MGRIDGEITPTIKTNLEGFAADATSEMPFLRTATAEEREKLVKMGQKSVGFVEDVYAAACAFSEVFPSTFNLEAFTKDIKLKGELPYIKQLFLSFVEKIDDTDLLLGSDLKVQALEAYGFLKMAAKNNAAVKTSVDSIAEYWEGRGKKKANTTFSISSSSSVTVVNVVTGRAFLNNGSTLLKFKVGTDLIPKFPLAEAITVDPGNSAMIPKGWTIIDVTNLSGTAAGSFSVKLK